METKKFLPIGSVVLLREGSKRVMITGYLSVVDGNESTIYDYNGCMFPEGFLSSDQSCLFNHDQIDKIDYLGYQDEEQKEFSERLNEMYKEISDSRVDTL